MKIGTLIRLKVDSLTKAIKGYWSLWEGSILLGFLQYYILGYIPYVKGYWSLRIPLLGGSWDLLLMIFILHYRTNPKRFRV